MGPSTDPSGTPAHYTWGTWDKFTEQTPFVSLEPFLIVGVEYFHSWLLLKKEARNRIFQSPFLGGGEFRFICEQGLVAVAFCALSEYSNIQLSFFMNLHSLGKFINKNSNTVGTMYVFVITFWLVHSSDFFKKPFFLPAWIPSMNI